jgi:hypothetical protein
MAQDCAIAGDQHGGPELSRSRDFTREGRVNATVQALPPPGGEAYSNLIMGDAVRQRLSVGDDAGL